MSPSYFDKICRVCINSAEPTDLKPIWDMSETESLTISTNSKQSDSSKATMLSEFTRFGVSMNDGLPKNMCRKCLFDVENAFIFKQKCMQSETILREHIKSLQSKKSANINHTDNAENLEEECQYQNESGHNQSVETDVNDYESISCSEIFIKDEPLESGNSAEHIVYQCFKCFAVFATTDDLEQHILNECHTPLSNSLDFTATPSKMKPRLYNCGLCTDEFTNQKSMERHRESHPILLVNIHDINAKNMPENISKTISTIRKKRKSSAGDDAIYVHRLNQKSNIIHHDKEISEIDKPYKCTECPASFIRKTDRNRHMKTQAHSRSVIKRAQSFVCNICNKRFTFHFRLKKHMLRHNGIKILNCNRCPETFVTRFELDSHAKFHSASRPFSCHVCHKNYSRNDNLKVHLKRHNQSKKFPCDVESCSKSFVTKQEYDFHRKTHSACK